MHDDDETCPDCHGETETLEERCTPLGCSDVAVPCETCDGGHSAAYVNKYQAGAAS